MKPPSNSEKSHLVRWGVVTPEPEPKPKRRELPATAPGRMRGRGESKRDSGLASEAKTPAVQEAKQETKRGALGKENGVGSLKKKVGKCLAKQFDMWSIKIWKMNAESNHCEAIQSWKLERPFGGMGFWRKYREKDTNLHEAAYLLDQLWIARCPCLFAKDVPKITALERIWKPSWPARPRGLSEGDRFGHPFGKKSSSSDSSVCSNTIHKASRSTQLVRQQRMVAVPRHQAAGDARNLTSFCDSGCFR